MASLRNCSEDLRSYLHQHHMPELFESLLTAILVNKPDDVRQFMLSCLLQCEKDPHLIDNLAWDTFIYEDLRPTAFRLQSAFDFLWAYEDGSKEPSSEMYSRAYSFYHRKLLLMCFGAIYDNWKYKLQKRRALRAMYENAAEHHRLRMEQVHFIAWLTWLRKEKERQRCFVKELTRIFNISLERLIFTAWRNVVVDAINTREYFAKIERGEMMNRDEDSSEKKDHISLLPKAVAINVFRFVNLPDLVSCSKVCRAWKVLTQESVLWSRVDLTKIQHTNMSNKAFSSLIMKCRPFLCHLNVRACNYLMPRALKAIGDCRNLQDLNLSECAGVTDDVIRDIALGCSSLLYVNISRNEISDGSLRFLSRYCNNIQYLNISHCPNISNKGVMYLASGKGSQKLIYLDISGLQQVTPEALKAVSKGCKRLNSIFLNEMQTMMDESVEALFQDCKTVKTTCILHSPLLTDGSLKALSHNRKLTTLKLEGNARVTDAAIKVLVHHCPELRHIYLVDFQRLTDMTLKALGQCRNLVVLNVADCVRFSDTGVRYLVEGHSGPKIRELNLTNCIRVSDVSLLRISQRCKSLLYINVSYCEHVTDAGIELLATIPSLTSLDMSGCNLTDAGIISLGNNPNFRDLVMSECSAVTDVGIQKLVTSIRDLQALDMSHLYELTDNAFKSLAYYCRRLGSVNLSGCHKLSDNGLCGLCSVCQFIDNLDISGCRLVTDASLRFIRKGCRNMRQLTMLYCKSVSQYAVAKMQLKMPYTHILHSQDDGSHLFPEPNRTKSAKKNKRQINSALSNESP